MPLPSLSFPHPIPHPRSPFASSLMAALEKSVCSNHKHGTCVTRPHGYVSGIQTQQHNHPLQPTPAGLITHPSRRRALVRRCPVAVASASCGHREVGAKVLFVSMRWQGQALDNTPCFFLCACPFQFSPATRTPLETGNRGHKWECRVGVQ